MSETKADHGEEQLTFTQPAPQLRPYIRAGSLLVQRSFGDTVRWYLPYPVDAQTSERYPHLAVNLLASYYGVADTVPTIRDTFDLGPIHAPIGEEGEMLIRYIGPKGSFPYVPYADVYDGSWRAKRGPDFFRDKIVLVGLIRDFTDRQNTPQGDMQGAEILMNATQTLLQHNWVRHLSEQTNFLVQLALCLLLSLTVWRFGIGGGAVCLPVTALLWSVFANRLFAASGLWIDTVEPLGAVTTTFVLTSPAELAEVRRKFSRFMPRRDAALALRTDNLEAHTAEQEAAIAFADIRQYTTLSENLPSAMVDAFGTAKRGQCALAEYQCRRPAAHADHRADRRQLRCAAATARPTYLSDRCGLDRPVEAARQGQRVLVQRPERSRLVVRSARGEAGEVRDRDFERGYRGLRHRVQRLARPGQRRHGGKHGQRRGESQRGERRPDRLNRLHSARASRLNAASGARFTFAKPGSAAPEVAGSTVVSNRPMFRSGVICEPAAPFGPA